MKRCHVLMLGLFVLAPNELFALARYDAGMGLWSGSLEVLECSLGNFARPRSKDYGTAEP